MMPHFDALPQLFEYRLGMALKMEQDSMNMLQMLGGAAQATEARSFFAQHYDETRVQFANLERVFELLGFEREAHPSPATEALLRDGMEMLARTDRALLDEVLLTSALSVEHYEISVYEGLLIAAQAIGADEASPLLEQNLEQERRASESLAAAARAVAARVPGRRA